MFWVEHLPWDYGVELHQEWNKIKVAFQPLPMADIMGSVKALHDEPEQVPLKEVASPESCPTFGPHPNTHVADFDFKKKMSIFPSSSIWETFL